MFSLVVVVVVTGGRATGCRVEALGIGTGEQSDFDAAHRLAEERDEAAATARSGEQYRRLPEREPSKRRQLINYLTIHSFINMIIHGKDRE